MRKLYKASRIKRFRATKAQIADRRRSLVDIARANEPATVRGIYYLASVASLVEKTESGYDKVQTDLTKLRRQGALPYGWITDGTRFQRKPRSYSGVQEALESTARLYRKALWDDVPAYVEIWLEKDALSGVIYPVTSLYDVPLMVARGYASLSFLHEAAEYIADLEVPTYIYHLGDFDPSGVNAGEKIEETLRELAARAEIHFERLAVTPEQIEQWRLPTRPTKTTDSRSKGFGLVSVELDAIEPNFLRDIVEQAIQRHLPVKQFEVLKVAEESERQLIGGLVGMAKRTISSIDGRPA